MKINRRDFIRKSSLTAAGAGLFTILPSSVWGAKVAPSDRINVGLIGCRNHGFSILRHHLANEGVHCVALCDVDENVLNSRAESVKEINGDEPRLYKDYRRMLELDEMDAVIIGTPDHWQCLNFVHACEAGKDIYVEKPLANTIAECAIMVKAANRYDSVVQVGQQQRSNTAFLETVGIVKSGGIGKLRKIEIWANFNYGIGANFAEDRDVPEGIDYDLWLGPAPERPFNNARFHGSWRHFWDYGGGLFSDWGVHLLDMALWPDNLLGGPEKVMSYASNTSEQSRMRDTFDTMSVLYPKKDYVIQYNMTAGIQVGPWDRLYGVAFVGDDGTIVTNRDGYMLQPEYDQSNNRYRAESRNVSTAGEAHDAHVKDFLDCIKTRNTPSCTPEMGYAAALHAHIPNIAARVGETYLEWDEENMRFKNSEAANRLVTPEYRRPWRLPEV